MNRNPAVHLSRGAQSQRCSNYEVQRRGAAGLSKEHNVVWDHCVAHLELIEHFMSTVI